MEIPKNSSFDTSDPIEKMILIADAEDLHETQAKEVYNSVAHKLGLYDNPSSKTLNIIKNDNDPFLIELAIKSKSPIIHRALWLNSNLSNELHINLINEYDKLDHILGLAENTEHPAIAKAILKSSAYGSFISNKDNLSLLGNIHEWLIKLSKQAD